jgi:hypothetical protein
MSERLPHPAVQKPTDDQEHVKQERDGADTSDQDGPEPVALERKYDSEHNREDGNYALPRLDRLIWPTTEPHGER